MSKSKYGHPTFPVVSTVESGDPSKDIAKMDRTGTKSGGPSSDSSATKSGLETLDKD